MKTLRDAFELAKAAANESGVPIWLVGKKGAITDIGVQPGTDFNGRRG